jgi:hypothetical protein
MAAGIAAGQRLTRWNYERVALKDDEVLIVPGWADLLRLQAVLVGFAAAVQISPGTGLPSQPLPCARALDRHRGERHDGHHHPNPSEPLATHHVPRDLPVFLGDEDDWTEVIWAEAGVMDRATPTLMESACSSNYHPRYVVVTFAHLYQHLLCVNTDFVGPPNAAEGARVRSQKLSGVRKQ